MPPLRAYVLRPLRYLVPATLVAFFAAHPQLTRASKLEPATGHSLAFLYGTADPENEDDIEQLASWVDRRGADAHFEARGYYCDADRALASTDAQLTALATERARKLKQLLVEQGVDEDRLKAVAFGTVPGTWSCQATLVTASR